MGNFLNTKKAQLSKKKQKGKNQNRLIVLKKLNMNQKKIITNRFTGEFY